MNSLYLTLDKTNIPVKKIRFPAGETLIRIEMPESFVFYDGRVNANIDFNFKDNGDIFDLMLLVDAIRREIYFPVTLTLTMPYLPYARQDRVMSKGESLSVKVLADLINSLNFSKVFCKDIHSGVGVALINNLVNIPQDVCAQKLGYELSRIKDKVVLIAPDAGSLKKTEAFAKRFKIENVLCATKDRNVLTGEITGIIIPELVHEEFPEDTVFVVLDDICDGGKTFIELAKHIRQYANNNLYLYVTHGIFSKGTAELEKYYNHIYVSNLMNDNIIDTMFIKEI